MALFISFFCRTTGKSRPNFNFASISTCATSSLHNIDPSILIVPARFDPMVRFQSHQLLDSPDRVDFGFAVLARIFKLGGYKPPDAIIVSTSLIQGLFNGNRIVEAMELFKMLVTKKLCNEITYHTVIDGLCKSGNSCKAIQLIRILERDEGSNTSVMMYNTVIDSLCKDDEKVRDTLELLFEMTVTTSTPPNIFTYTSVIQVLCGSGISHFGFYRSWEEVKRLLRDMINADIYPSVVILNMIVDTFSEIGLDLEHFLTILVKMSQSPKNVLIYNALLEVQCERTGDVQILQIMRDAGYEPTISSYNIVLKHHWKMFTVTDRIDNAFSFFFKEIIGRGLEPDVVTYNTMVQGLFSCYHFDDAKNWIKYMRTQGFGQDTSSNVIWIDELCSSGHISEGYSLLCKMVSSGAPVDISAFNFVIDGLCTKSFRDGLYRRKNQKPYAARDLFNKIPSLGLEADDKTFNIMIYGMCREGLIEDAREMQKKMKECGFVAHFMIYN